MEAYVEPHCPFCRTDNTVSVYAERTSVYDTLYRCGLCYKVFDEKERRQQELEMYRKPKKEERQPDITVKLPKKKRGVFIRVILMMLVIGFSYYYFF